MLAKDLRAYVKTQFELDLAPCAAWGTFDLTGERVSGLNGFIADFLDEYPDLVRTHSELKDASRPLFFAMLAYAAQQPMAQYWWAGRMPRIMALLTSWGAHDISTEQAGRLAPLLEAHLERGGNSIVYVAICCEYSQALWEILGAAVLNAGASSQGPKNRYDLIKALLRHRYEPDNIVLDPSTLYTAYEQMCGGTNSPHPNLLDMPRILMPLHHRPLAWSIALDMCQSPGAGQWMALEKAFVSLAMPAANDSCWDILLHLNEHAQNDTSCLALLAAMRAVHPELVQAFDGIWPAIAGMYECSERREAIHRWRTERVHQETLALPDLTIDR